MYMSMKCPRKHGKKLKLQLNEHCSERSHIAAVRENGYCSGPLGILLCFPDACKMKNYLKLGECDHVEVSLDLVTPERERTASLDS